MVSSQRFALAPLSARSRSLLRWKDGVQSPWSETEKAVPALAGRQAKEAALRRGPVGATSADAACDCFLQYGQLTALLSPSPGPVKPALDGGVV